MKHAIAIAALLAGAGTVGAETQVLALTYTCERGVEVPAVYINVDEEPGIAVIGVEGGMFNLEAEPVASGVRYGYPSDGSHYVWLTKGETAMLLWYDGTDGSEETLLADCTSNQ